MKIIENEINILISEAAKAEAWRKISIGVKYRKKTENESGGVSGWRQP
jgi:hypothetical protein